MHLSGLLKGQASAFVNIHLAAMLSLVVGPAPMKAESCPETLLLDVHRLVLYRAEFQYVVTAATIIITTAHSLCAAKNLDNQQVI